MVIMCDILNENSLILLGIADIERSIQKLMIVILDMNFEATLIVS